MNGAISASIVRRTEQSVYADVREVISRLQPTEPVYLFSETSLKRRVRRFQRGFPGIVGYAVKANPEARVLRTLVAEGLTCFDVASLTEVQTLAATHPGATLHFNNPVKAPESIARAYRDYGVRSFALDDTVEFEKIRAATGGDQNILYSLRFSLPHRDARYDFGSKFGATPEAALDLLRRIANSGARPALAFHPGSQCSEPEVYRRYLEAAADLINLSGVEVEQINVGGGFPEQYANVSVPPLECYFETIERTAVTQFQRPPSLVCEPGRAMVASCTSLLVRVVHVREDGRTIFLNDGVYGGLLEQTQVDLSLPLRAWREGRQLSGSQVLYRVFGPTCDPVDRLREGMALPQGLRTGDYLEFGLLGAYGSATASAFNGFHPARYLNVVEGFCSG